MRKFSFILLASFIVSGVAHAQSTGGLFSGGMKGVRTYAGVGFANYNVTTPDATFKMNDGIYVYLGGERAINDSGLSLTITLNYMTTDGTANYDYTTLGGTHYTGSDVKFDSNNYQLGMGLRQRLFPTSWFRPYIEGGGLFGYHQIKYNGNLSNITTSGPGAAGDFKKSDSLTGFGYYGEGGFEVDFSESYGTRVGLRYQKTKTKKFETLGDQALEYDNLLFIFALLLRF
jgi:hypothetical protein